MHDLPTPALIVDASALRHNIDTMAAARPGASLRPHIKAFKCTALAKELVAAGHELFCCATIREIEGMAAAGVGSDLLLANETLDASRLGALDAFVTVAVDSDATVEAAAAGGVGSVMIDVNVGLPRCGCDPGDAGRLAELARSKGLDVRGVMGYEGHIVSLTDREKQRRKVAESMALLTAAHNDVGGEIVSAGGTGTYDCNEVATEIQAGSYVFMDTHYNRMGLPFRQALFVLASVISVNEAGGWVVADAGLKCLGMDHGDPDCARGEVWFCSDEHVTIKPTEDDPISVGEKVQLTPAHVDPTVAKHEVLHIVEGEDVIDTWAIDLRHW